MTFPRTHFKYFCGPAAIRAIRLYLDNVDVPELYYAKAMKTDEGTGCTTRFQMIKCLRRYGHKCEHRHNMTKRQVKNAFRKGVVLAAFWNHWAILWGEDEEGVISWFDGTGRTKKMDFDELMRCWIEKGPDGEILVNYGIVVRR